MTNREMLLLATSILFASTTLGLSFQGCLRNGREYSPRHHMEHPGSPGKPDFFAMADADNDGFITRNEILARQQAKLDDMFATVDTDRDGKLSKPEMDKGRELMRAKWKARFEAERAVPAAPAASMAQ